ncbi:putative global transcription activator SNF2L2 isoform a [Reticulomyxa filosa]|uniref:Putative global transcription activator SNF2L2 isoform a n=1 Tax=Reticulomyxa filosa TaxID=46433 RepID=X6NG75_RETFI|nr:putative global transcription activator SNF2L2 isoform a [Reticulomyxa filosa]|eukprot:ETO24868.1 putative global transcription activator SNF2L2 isoform a [Reticulomyxa filosa]
MEENILNTRKITAGLVLVAALFVAVYLYSAHDQKTKESEPSQRDSSSPVVAGNASLQSQQTQQLQQSEQSRPSQPSQQPQQVQQSQPLPQQNSATPANISPSTTSAPTKSAEPPRSPNETTILRRRGRDAPSPGGDDIASPQNGPSNERLSEEERILLLSLNEKSKQVRTFHAIDPFELYSCIKAHNDTIWNMLTKDGKLEHNLATIFSFFALLHYNIAVKVSIFFFFLKKRGDEIKKNETFILFDIEWKKSKQIANDIVTYYLGEDDNPWFGKEEFDEQIDTWMKHYFDQFDIRVERNTTS